MSAPAGALPAEGLSAVATQAAVDTPLPARPIRTLKFPLTAAARPLDLVWVIDNSSSMAEEAAHVRANFSRFIAAVSERSDLRIALISLRDGVKSSAYGVTMPSTSVPHQQIDLEIQSNNGLAAAAILLCPVASTTFPSPIPRDRVEPASTEHPGGRYVKATVTPESNRICGTEWRLTTVFDGPAVVSPRGIDRLPGAEKLLERRAALADFLRPEAKKSVIIVTDDAPFAVDAGNFAEMMRAVSPHDPVTLFAFAGLRQGLSGCVVDNLGTDYLTLARQSGGAVYDICEANWTPHFEALAAASSALAPAHFPLPAALKHVLAVRIGGRKLAVTDYRTEAGGVQIHASALKPGNIEAEIDVE